MTRKTPGGIFTVILCSSLALRAWAAVNVGDKPILQFRAANGGQQVSLEQLRGKIVVVDFWATWCGPCMAEADHMVQVNTQYAPKGLQFIGVSLDNSVPDMLRVAKEKNFNWPQYCDSGGWQSKAAQQWGVQSIPHTFIVGPDGDVVWHGHPGNIDAALASAFKKTPPRLVDPKLLADASAAADKIDAYIKDGGQAAAIKLLATISPDVKKDGKMADRLAGIEKQLEEYANKSIDEVDPLIQNKQYVEAANKLSDLTKGLASLPAGATAKKKLSELMSNPEFKAQFEAAQKAKAADEELAIAKRLQSDGKDEQAYLRFKGILTKFAGTPAADEAKTAVANYEKNPALVQKANDTAAAGKAKGMLGMAENYAKLNRNDLAKKKYQEVITAYPGTTYAKQAQAAIDEIDRKGK
jgi:thiol-disulfide isomerase/thioredoxin